MMFSSLVLFTLLSINSAFAHAQIVATYPVDGMTVQNAPSEIIMSWGEQVKAVTSQFSLITSTGQKIPFKLKTFFDSSIHEGSVHLIPTSRLQKNAYIVSWLVISKDGHPVAGTFAFGFKTAAAPAKRSVSNATLNHILQVLFWCALVLLFALSLIRVRKKILISLAFLFIVALLRFVNSILTLNRDFLYAGTSRVSLMALIIVSFIGIYLYAEKVLINKLNSNKTTEKKPIVVLFATVLIFLSQSFFEGHALDTTHQNFLKVISATHLLFAFIWIGSVLALLLNPTRDQYSLTRKISQVSLIGLIVCGFILFYFLGLPLKPINKSTWIMIFIIKMAFVFMAAFFGIFHHFVGKKIGSDANFSLRKSLTIEVILMAGVLVSSSFLVSYIPPKLDSRQLSINQIGNTTTTFGGYQQTKFIFKNHLNAVLYVQKVKLGKPAMIMIGFDSSKEPKSRTLDLYLTNDSLKIHDLHISLQRVSGQYMTYATIPGNGLWHIYAELGIDDFNQSQAAFNVQI